MNKNIKFGRVFLLNFESFTPFGINLSQKGFLNALTGILARGKEMKIKSNRKKTTELTEREIQIIEYIGLGWTDEEISKKVGCAPITIRQSVSRILKKKNLFNRPSLIMWACKNDVL